jgi:hypothetical protein
MTASPNGWATGEAQLLLAQLFLHGFRGFDPFDGLSTGILRGLARGSLLRQRLVTQAVKRSPMLLQPLLGIRPGVSATTAGYALVASARLCRTAESSIDIARLVPRLAGFTRSLAVVDSRDELAWGSHVDVATRFGYTPASAPNVVVTACAAHGLASATAAGLVDERPALKRIACFVEKRLSRRTPEGQRWYAYTTDGRTMIHNGSMLAAVTLLRCGELLQDRGMIDEGWAAAETTLGYQLEDGSWRYAEHPGGDWEDSFHTGFVLESLLTADRLRQAKQLRAALVRGGQHYAKAYFGPAGQPWYSTQRPYPLDAMSAAQGLEVLPALAPVVPAAGRSGVRLLDWCRESLCRPDGTVAYQVHRRWTDMRQFPRWSIAPMAAALAAAGCATPPLEAVAR